MKDHIFELRRRYEFVIHHRSYAHNLSSCEIKASAVQIYDLSYIHLHSYTFNGYITNSQCDQLPDGLMAQLVEHCTGIAEEMTDENLEFVVGSFNVSRHPLKRALIKGIHVTYSKTAERSTCLPMTNDIRG